MLVVTVQANIDYQIAHTTACTDTWRFMLQASVVVVTVALITMLHTAHA